MTWSGNAEDLRRDPRSVLRGVVSGPEGEGLERYLSRLLGAVV